MQNYSGYALKADIRHYFDTVDHEILLNMICRKIKDPDLVWLIKRILANHKTEFPGKGMPLGNLTSQFFANVYLHELDLFVKHQLKARYYIRYVDDFVIFHRDKALLESWKTQIGCFLAQSLGLELHPEKSSIMPISSGITMLGFRVFRDYRLLKRSNSRRIWKRLGAFKRSYANGTMPRSRIANSIAGWLAYSRFAETFHLRKRVYLSAKEIFQDKYFRNATSQM
jgi:hypothetical protein